jgi:hypothetical protein
VSPHDVNIEIIQTLWSHISSAKMFQKTRLQDGCNNYFTIIVVIVLVTMPLAARHLFALHYKISLPHSHSHTVK